MTAKTKDNLYRAVVAVGHACARRRRGVPRGCRNVEEGGGDRDSDPKGGRGMGGRVRVPGGVAFYPRRFTVAARRAGPSGTAGAVTLDRSVGSCSKVEENRGRGWAGPAGLFRG